MTDDIGRSHYSTQITALVTTSPIPSHPDTRILYETLSSIRFWFPHSPIRILCDGVRPELEHRRQQYDRYIQALVSDPPANTSLSIYNHHMHQAIMIRDAIDDVTTPLVLISEHDLPMLTNSHIDWPAISQAILQGKCDCVRLMLQESIHPEHLFLMLGEFDFWDATFVKTRQFSMWTHLASTGFYRQMLRGLSPNARCFLEPYMQGVVDIGPWEDHKLAIYLPDPVSSRRIYHTNGRESDPKLEHLDIYR